MRPFFLKKDRLMKESKQKKISEEKSLTMESKDYSGFLLEMVTTQKTR